MQTEEAKVVNTTRSLFVNLPLTKPTGKIRVKQRSFFSEYGVPVAPRQTVLSHSHYVEWQIGYDLLATTENRGKTSLEGMTFRNYKKDVKFAYELSELLWYSHQRGLIEDTEIRNCHDAIKQVSEANTFEESTAIMRTHPRERIINGLSFYEMQVSYPLFVHRFGPYEIFAEIMIREKQRAIGTQAMLYVCLPVTTLRFAIPIIGRTLNAKECAEWHIGRGEASLTLEMFRVFGMLSPKHRYDVMAILELLFPSIRE